ncbi:superoxide dismutase family protein [Virgibacillus ainsalahensis]
MKRWMMVFFALAIVVLLSACGGNEESENNQEQGNQNQEEQQNDEASENNTEDAVESNSSAEEEVLVSLNNANGDIVGTATLTEDESGVNVSLEGTDLPAGTHGFHIHETGVCEGPDFESAGGHYNPTDANHGFDDPEGPHAGDLENIEVAEDGTVNTEVSADMVTLEQDGDNTLYTEEGTALVIHSEADDYESQPSGDAGDRIACGVIGE